MRNEAPTPVDEVLYSEAAVLVPLATIAVEVGETVDQLVDRFSGHVQLNSVGMRCVPADAAMRFFAERYEQRKRQEADRARRAAEAAKKTPVRAWAPAIEGASPYESMLAGAGGVVTPEQEFGGGRERPRFLEEALEKSHRELAQRRAETAEKKDRAAAALKDQLGGKP